MREVKKEVVFMADKVDAFSRMDGLRADFTKVNTLSAALKIAKSSILPTAS